VFCVFQVGYNEYDVTLPVGKRVQWLVRKVRDVIAQDSGDSEMMKSEVSPEVSREVSPVVEKEIKVDTFKSFTPGQDKTTSDFLRQLLKSDSFFSPDMQNISDPNTKEAKTKTRKKKTVLQADSTVAVETNNASSELTSAVNSVKEVKTRSRKKRTEPSDLDVDPASSAESSNVEPESSMETSPVGEVKTRARRKKTKSTSSSGELAQSS